MRESIAECLRELDASLELARDACARGAWMIAREAARRALSAGSKLHARTTLLAEFADDAKLLAEAEHQAQDARQKYPLPLAGDQPLPFPSPEEKPAPRRKGPRK